MFGKYAQYQPCARASAIPKKPQLKRGKQKQQNTYSSPFTGFLPTRGGGYGVYTYGGKSTNFSSLYPRAFIYRVTGSNMESNPEQTCLAKFSSSFGLLRWHGDSRLTSEAPPLRQPTTEQCARSVPQLNDVLFHLLKRLSAIDQHRPRKKNSRSNFAREHWKKYE